MANEGSERGGSFGIDLNRRISSMPVARRERQDLGSNLSLGLASSPNTEDISSYFEAFPVMDSLNSHPPYSPSSSLVSDVHLADSLPVPSEIPELEYVPFLPRDEHNFVSEASDGLAFDVRLRSGGVYRDVELTLEDGGVILRGSLNSDGLSGGPFFGSSNGHVRLPRFVPPLTIPYRRSETGVGPFIPLSEFIMNGTGSAAQEPNDFVEYRIQRLMEAYEGQRPRVSRSSGSAASDSPLTCPDRLMQNIIQSGISLAARRNERKGKNLDGSNNLEENGEDAALTFECNICFELAKDPVVTPCGHLFCWPCLYQWLFAHSRYSECPVCKGEVLEVNVTPIYGHGGTDSSSGKQCIDGESNLKIPPRPRAGRVENVREQLQMPVLQREAHVNRRQFSDEVVTIRAAMLSRLLATTLSNREAGQSNPPGFALIGSVTSIPQDHPQVPPGFSPIDNVTSIPRHHRQAIREDFVLSAAPHLRIQRTASLSATEQNSNSSTMAVIQDDSITTETSAGPSWPVATRTRSRRVRTSSGSQGTDDSEQERSRRRLN